MALFEKQDQMSYNKHISLPLVYPDFLQRSPDLGAGQVPIMPVHHQMKTQQSNIYPEKENLNNREDYRSVHRSLDKNQNGYLGKHHISIIPEEKEQFNDSVVIHSPLTPRPKFEN